MAVGAAHLTFIDLSFDDLPASPAHRVRGYVGDFVALVIEFEHDDVGTTTVDARMHLEVLDDVPSNFVPLCGDSCDDSIVVPRVIRRIVLGVRLSEARPTPTLELLGLGSSDWRELAKRLGLAAARTGLHLNT